METLIKYPTGAEMARTIEKFGLSPEEERRWAARQARRGTPYHKAMKRVRAANAAIAGFQYGRSIVEGWGSKR
jgi:hypothetical protein